MPACGMSPSQVVRTPLELIGRSQHLRHADGDPPCRAVDGVGDLVSQSFGMSGRSRFWGRSGQQPGASRSVRATCRRPEELADEGSSGALTAQRSDLRTRHRQRPVVAGAGGRPGDRDGRRREAEVREPRRRRGRNLARLLGRGRDGADRCAMRISSFTTTHRGNVWRGTSSSPARRRQGSATTGAIAARRRSKKGT